MVWTCTEDRNEEEESEFWVKCERMLMGVREDERRGSDDWSTSKNENRI